ncbi:unannotated protein [freshwater metagenome]|uniref:Unannotated protein n=1 Tax=freshwater metagenome TaxID=449393 RepID=A0A6J6WDZ1_9ZZZZ
MNADRVKEVGGDNSQTSLSQPLREQGCRLVCVASNRAQTIRTVMDRIHRCGDCQKDLRSTDIARRLVAANVLLTCLQGQPHGRSTVRIHTHTNKTSGDLSLQSFAH